MPDPKRVMFPPKGEPFWWEPLLSKSGREDARQVAAEWNEMHKRTPPPMKFENARSRKKLKKPVKTKG